MLIRIEGFGALAGEVRTGVAELEVRLGKVEPDWPAWFEEVRVRVGRGLYLFFSLDGDDPHAGAQVGARRTGWRLPPQELARVRRLLGLARLPQHQCTCGGCGLETGAPFGCEGHQIDLLDRLAELAERCTERIRRIERATGAHYYGR